MSTWEYQSLDVGGVASGLFKKGDLKRMNELGAQGWEAIAVYTNDRGGFGAGGAVLFKRKKSAEDWGVSPVDPKRPRKPTGRAPSRFD